MSASIERLTEQDYGALLPFLDRAFGFDPVQNGFLTFLPKLYRREAEPWRYNLAVRDPADGSLAAVLGGYPLDLTVAGRRLSCAALGNMAVEEQSRGQGLMTDLMRAAVAQCRADGYDLAVLGGQRQRYATFGFEPTGADRTFRLTDANLRHCFGNIPCDVTVRAVLADDPLLPFLTRLHDRQPFRAARAPSRFYDILCSWDYRPFVALREGRPIGYFLRKGDELREPILADAVDLFPLLRAARSRGETLTLILSPWETELCLAASAVAEEVGRLQWEIFAVFRFTPVLQALADLTADRRRGLPSGALTVSVEGAETLTVTVSDGAVTVRESTDRPKLTLSYSDAMAFFFSDLSAAREACDDPLRWLFPLPLSLRMADHA